LANNKRFIYTIGYQQTSVSELLSFISQNGIKRIIDVRQNPVSRKPGFSKKKISLLADKAGLEYVHVRDVGIESKDRKNLRTEADYKHLLDRYEKQISRKKQKQVETVAKLVMEKPSVLICYEADPEFCHRARLASVIARRRRIKPKHLVVT
jgi:uncharacterized protein (DUF488 family)